MPPSSDSDRCSVLIEAVTTGTRAAENKDPVERFIGMGGLLSFQGRDEIVCGETFGPGPDVRGSIQDALPILLGSKSRQTYDHDVGLRKLSFYFAEALGEDPIRHQP